MIHGVYQEPVLGQLFFLVFLTIYALPLNSPLPIWLIKLICLAPKKTVAKFLNSDPEELSLWPHANKIALNVAKTDVILSQNTVSPPKCCYP